MLANAREHYFRSRDTNAKADDINVTNGIAKVVDRISPIAALEDICIAPTSTVD